MSETLDAIIKLNQRVDTLLRENEGKDGELREYRDAVGRQVKEIERLSKRDCTATIELCYSTTINPFEREQLKVVDIGVADNCYVVESQVVADLQAEREALKQKVEGLEEYKEGSKDNTILCGRIMGEHLLKIKNLAKRTEVDKEIITKQSEEIGDQQALIDQMREAANICKKLDEIVYVKRCDECTDEGTFCPAHVEEIVELARVNQRNLKEALKQACTEGR